MLLLEIKEERYKRLVLFFFFDKLGISTYINRGIYPVQKSLGFTLIELLVVVLIIGILAAVAVPQYQTAVFKSRWASMLPLLEGLKKAHEVFYLANGYYIASTASLDLDSPCTGNDVLTCPGGFMVDNFAGAGIITEPANMYLTMIYCPGITDWADCQAKGDFRYQVYLDHSAFPGIRRCAGITDLGKTFCRSLR